METKQTYKITIDIWSDIVCPFCFIGKKKIELAIAKLNAEDKVKVIWHSFQLAPDFPLDSSTSTHQYLVERKGYPIDQVILMTNQLTLQGKEYGINFNFDIARSFNTLKAHQLIQWAKTKKKSNELKEALMLDYFTNGKDLSITDNLLGVILKVGLNVTEAEEILKNGYYIKQVQEDLSEAQELGIRGIPYFLINNITPVSGAQSDKTIENALNAALKNLKAKDNSTNGGRCIPNEGCK